MRFWKLQDGRLLAEEREGHFHLLSTGGRLERSYRTSQSSEREHLSTTTYTVEGAELRCRFSDDNTDGDGPPRTTDSVELQGLLPAIAPGAEAQLRQALASRESRAAEADQKEEARLKAFERDLPDFPGNAALEFVFAYDPDEAIVVRGPGGIEVWRETGYRYHGRARFDEIKEILKRRYKKRLRSFTPDLPDMKSGMAFNPE